MRGRVRCIWRVVQWPGMDGNDDVPLTNLDQPLFDDARATKGDLVDYLEAVSEQLLNELRDRPLSVVRARLGQKPFMQKNVPKYAPPWIKTVTIWAERSRREVAYALCNDWRTLLWFANQRAVEYHPTLARAGGAVHTTLSKRSWCSISTRRPTPRSRLWCASRRSCARHSPTRASREP